MRIVLSFLYFHIVGSFEKNMLIFIAYNHYMGYSYRW